MRLRDINLRIHNFRIAAYDYINRSKLEILNDSLYAIFLLVFSMLNDKQNVIIERETFPHL